MVIHGRRWAIFAKYFFKPSNGKLFTLSDA